MAAGAIQFTDNPSYAAPTMGTPMALTSLKNPSITGGMNVTSDDASVPAPHTVYIGTNGYLTLDAFANDTAQSGRRLFASWLAVSNSSNVGTGPSNYSIPLPPAPETGHANPSRRSGTLARDSGPTGQQWTQLSDSITQVELQSVLVGPAVLTRLGEANRY